MEPEMTQDCLRDFLDGKTPAPVFGRVEFFVVESRSMEWAAQVRSRMLQNPPAAVAVSLPEVFRPLAGEVTGLFPALALVGSQDVATPDPESGEPPHLVPAEATDPLWEAVRSALELDIRWRMVAPETPGVDPLKNLEPDTLLAGKVDVSKLMRLSLLQQRGGQGAFPDVDAIFAQVAAWHLQSLMESHPGGVLFVCESQWVFPVCRQLESAQPQPLRRIRRDDLRVYQVPPEIAALISAEPMGFVKLYEHARTGGGALPGRYEWTLALLQSARELTEKEFSTQLNGALFTPLLKYMRNLAFTTGRLFPTRYDLVVAARSFFDHDFGWYFFRLLTDAAEPPEGVTAPVLDLDPEQLGLAMRSVHFARKLRQQVPRFLSTRMDRPDGFSPEEWKNAFSEASMCSWPPEDLLIEGTALRLKQQGRQVIGERGRKTQPFTCTLLDGLDVRETVRNWFEKRIYVFEDISGKSAVGSVVLVFEEDEREDGQYPYCAHWYGEHDQESDMAFYATDPGEHVVGPGICRCEYGGLLLTTPPGRIWPVWEDPRLRFLRKKSQILLAAGLQLTREPVVLYIAPKPPEAFLKRLAIRMGLRILYMPIGQISPVRRKKLRSFHILAGQEARTWAHRFIPDL